MRILRHNQPAFPEQLAKELATSSLFDPAIEERVRYIIADVQKRHQENLLGIGRQIEAREAGVFVYCQKNRATLFPEKKSLDLLLATVGFELTPPRVDKIIGKDTFGKIGLRLENLDWGAAYVRYPDPEVNKEKILTDRAQLKPEQLQEAGLRIEQDENFFIRPKSDVAEQSVREAA